ncbi:class GN sortase [Parahaliea sp. F7430]|uniref:Class GN sortase n=1 Tax=Sediminihaliea albiluteola TaxID=2758564 RepID=A0A7W2TVR2_9GAMM|nr:class GN sortase [Sediminihaliea albiluteola]MBA6412839.1 class GN sortase [Sediminihaliea albiluteola]
MFRRILEQPRHWLLVVALVVAVQQLLSAALVYSKAALAPVLMERAWQLTLADGGRSHKPWPWADTWPVARLQVPALGIDQFVLAGASGNALAFGPGLDAAGRSPGEPGTAVIAGHRDTHFRFLQHLQPAMTLQLELPDGRMLRYRVAGAEVVDSRDVVEAPAQFGPAQLELVTCFPFDALRAGGPLRYVVRAEPGAFVNTELERRAAVNNGVLEL